MLALSTSQLGLNLAPRASVRMAAGGEQILLARFGVPAPDLSVDRRGALGLGAAACAALGTSMPAFAADDPMFTLPPLPYAYDALEPCVRRHRSPHPAVDPLPPPPPTPPPPPLQRRWRRRQPRQRRRRQPLRRHIDAATMKFHHDFHHQAYITNLNKAMAGKPKADLVSLMPGAKAAKLNNAGGGHYNHCMFWSTLGPKAGGEPSGALGDAMAKVSPSPLHAPPLLSSPPLSSSRLVSSRLLLSPRLVSSPLLSSPLLSLVSSPPIPLRRPSALRAKALPAGVWLVRRL